MKNKKLTYFLLLLVVSLWGYLIYKVFGAIHGNNESTPQITAVLPPIENLDYYRFKGQDTLYLNYRDPLYSTTGNIKQTAIQDITASAPTVPVANYPPPIMVPETVINYNGFIENETSKKRIAIVNIDNKQYMIGLGDTQQGLKVLEIQQNQVRVKFNGKIRIIHK